MIIDGHYRCPSRCVITNGFASSDCESWEIGPSPFTDGTVPVDFIFQLQSLLAVTVVIFCTAYLLCLLSHPLSLSLHWFIAHALVSNAYGGVACRICCAKGQSWKLGHGHLRRTLEPAAAADPMTNIVLWLMQYWSKELRVVDICNSWSRRLHNTWIHSSWI